MAVSDAYFYRLGKLAVLYTLRVRVGGDINPPQLAQHTNWLEPPGSTAGLEVGGCGALHLEITGGGGVPSVCLPAAVSVGTRSLGHGEDELALLRLTGLEHGNLHGLACCVEVGGDGGEVVDGGGHHELGWLMWLL